MHVAFVAPAPFRAARGHAPCASRRSRANHLRATPRRVRPCLVLRARRPRPARAFVFACADRAQSDAAHGDDADGIAPAPVPDGTAEVIVVVAETDSTDGADGADGPEKDAATQTWRWRGPDGVLARVISAVRAAFSPGGFAWGLVAGAAITAGVFFLPDSSVDSVLREKVAIFDFILQDINSSYVDRVDIDKLFETGVNSMLGTLDPYTQFENNAEALEMSLRTSGRYAGVGLGISTAEPDPRVDAAPAETEERPHSRITIVSAFEGYAFDAGVRPGDVIEAVGTKSIDGMSLEAVTDLLRGEPGTSVDISVLREGREKPMMFTLQRRSVHIRDVPVCTLVGAPENGIGYVRLQSFAKDAAAEVRGAITQLTADAEAAAPGRGLRGLVLDLRGNPGGLLNAAIEVSESFVPRDSVIVSTKGRGMGAGPTYRSNRDPALPPGTRLAVLVNGQTASASEIVAGAVQDLDLGVVVGSRTFGKGLVQNVQELPYRTALKYTVGKYYTPSGRCIQALDYRQGGRAGGVHAGNDDGADGGAQFQASEITDANRKEFRTAGGRRVRDGGGIEPDVPLAKRASFLELALSRQNMFFKFANRFAATRGIDNLAEPFGVSDSLFKDFVNFVAGTRFRYESQFDDAFDQLDSMLESVGYDAARGRVADLRRATEMEMREDFVRHEGDLRVMLESAIRFRFQPDSSRIKAELKNDDMLAEAVRVLQSPREYSAYLQPAQAVVDAEAVDVVPASKG